jgi:holo-[acyl-carrier protein] synthase
MIYGIGIDLVKVDRLAAAIERYGERFLNRVFTPGEIAYCRGKSWDGIRWREVEVVPNKMGKPEIRVSGRAAALCAAAQVTGMHVSLTDEDDRALAVVILEK